MGAPGCKVVVIRNRMYAYRPDYGVPPGEKISETLGFRGLTLSDLAARIGWQERIPAEVTDEEAAVSPELACELEKAPSAR
jgi:plasmid maintenance system antidote protein VapI